MKTITTVARGVLLFVLLQDDDEKGRDSSISDDELNVYLQDADDLDSSDNNAETEQVSPKQPKRLNDSDEDAFSYDSDDKASVVDDDFCGDALDPLLEEDDLAWMKDDEDDSSDDDEIMPEKEDAQ